MKIVPVPGAQGADINFGGTATQALADGKIDGFWANGMGAEVAVKNGVGTVVLDIRRGDGPAACFNYTMASIATTDQLIEKSPAMVAAAVRAIVGAQQALKKELATQAAQQLFPPNEAALIKQLIERDLPYYRAVISPEFVAGMNRFTHDVGIADGQAPYDRVVANQFSGLW